MSPRDPCFPLNFYELLSHLLASELVIIKNKFSHAQSIKFAYKFSHLLN